MKKKAFISGITGQDGAYLSKLLIGKGYEVHGGVRRISQPSLTRLDFLGVSEHVHLHDFDLSEPNGIFRTIDNIRPHEFYNLAAQSFVASSWTSPIYTAEVDAVAVARILDALRTVSPDTRFYQASTSEMFGLVQEIPQKETTRFYPRSPYGAAKAFGHYLTLNYRESFGLHASSGILFNHESPLRGQEFVTRKITRGLAKIARGGGDAVRLGNLDAKRDWGYAAEYVEGMWRMLQQDEADDYVLATGVSTSIREFTTFAADALDIELEWRGCGENEIAVHKASGAVIIEVDPKFYRPAEVDALLGDASKAQKRLGWKSTVGVAALAQMMATFDYDALS